MSEAHAAQIDLHEVIESDPIKPHTGLRNWMWGFIMLGIAIFCYQVFSDPKHLWGSFYVNLLVFMGLSIGAVMTTVIFQIVRATWSPPIRRLAEANIAFLPTALILLLTTYFGKEYLFPWARGPMPGREWWMQADFVYVRLGLLLCLLFFLLTRYIRMSLRSDVGMLREKSRNERWHSYEYEGLLEEWNGTEKETVSIQRQMSFNAPILIIAYALIYSLFAFEMVMGMDTVWYSNMFGGFLFIGNIYMGWAVIALTAITLAKYNRGYAKILNRNHLWDLGKLNFAFCMLWGYLFFAQFLPQWYGNMPEETQWLIVRTREMPWKCLGWMTFSLCFVIPFILLLSRDVKRTPKAYGVVAVLILIGMWIEKYVLVMPQLYPSAVPFGFTDVGLFLGFLGAYVLSVQSFLAKYPYIPVSHPLTRGNTEW